jgi:hypothetical protein
MLDVLDGDELNRAARKLWLEQIQICLDHPMTSGCSGRHNSHSPAVARLTADHARRCTAASGIQPSDQGLYFRVCLHRPEVPRLVLRIGRVGVDLATDRRFVFGEEHFQPVRSQTWCHHFLVLHPKHFCPNRCSMTQNRLCAVRCVDQERL